MNTNVTMIPVAQLHPHPDNPRKDLGDITELTASIKANGVLQNLTVVPRANPDVNYEISIHALLAESDPFTTSMSTRLVGFLSTLSLRRATYAPLTSELHCLFLSTLSLRRATHPGQPVRGMPSHFYPRSPCGERRSVASVAFASVLISIHTLLAESDTTRLW